jgi:signal transduction histidine kinase/CheY-like chemotaxis protein
MSLAFGVVSRMLPGSLGSGGPRARIDREGNVSGWDPALEALWGRPAAQALGRKIDQLLVALEPELLPDLLSVQCAGTWSGVVALVPSNGNAPRTTGIRLSRSGDGLELQLAPLSVLASEGPSDDAPLEPGRDLQRFAALLEMVPGYCYTVDRELTFTSSAGKGLAVLNLRPGQVIGVNMRALWGTREDTYEPLVCHLKALAGIAATYRDVCLGRSIEYLIRPLRSDAGDVVGAIGVAIDVTEAEHARQEREKLVAQLRQAQKMEAMGRLAGSVAHDFNNFLTCIMGNLSLLEKHVSQGSEAEALIAQTNIALDSAASLTRQLLAFSRKQVFSPRPLNVSSLVERMHKILQRLAGTRISVRTDCHVELWSVNADAGQLEQVLVNLVLNARDSISDEGQIVITTRNERGDTPHPAESCDHPGEPPEPLRPGNYVALSVSDSGRGLSDVERARLFETFFTSKDLGQGTGLGLATVYATVQQSGGTLSVESELGKGTTFRVLLPRAAAAPALEAAAVSNGRELAVAGGTETVLLVEDEPLVLEFAQRTLQQLGYNVLPCSSSDEALRLFGEYQNRVQLVVTDVRLPRLTGKDLAARLRALSPGVAVLFCSGAGDAPLDELATGGDSIGCDTINKPYRPRELASKVRQLLDQRRS